MVTVVPADEGWGQAFSSFGKGLTEGSMNRADQMALQNAVDKLDPNADPRDVIKAVTAVPTYNNASKQQFIQNSLSQAKYHQAFQDQAAKHEIAKEKNRIAAERNEIAKTKAQPQSEEATIQNYEQQGFTRQEAQALTNPHVPNSVKQGISRRVEAEISRGERNVNPENIKNIARQVAGEQVPEELPQQSNQIEQEALPPEEIVVQQSDQPAIQPTDQPTIQPENQKTRKPAEWPDLPAPPNTTSAEKEKWRDKNQTFNNKLLKETKDKHKANQSAAIRYNRLTELNESKKLPEGIGRVIINPNTGEPYAVASLLGLVNKETQDFTKTLNDFLIDAKTYFGGRITNFDLQAFKSRLPSLLNTADGRRLIIEQMKGLQELQTVHDDTLESALKHYGRNASYSDIQRIADEKTEAKEGEIIEKINNLDKASAYMDVMASNPKYKDTILMQNSKTGKFKAYRPSEVNEAKSHGWVKW